MKCGFFVVKFVVHKMTIKNEFLLWLYPFISEFPSTCVDKMRSFPQSKLSKKMIVKIGRKRSFFTWPHYENLDCWFVIKEMIYFGFPNPRKVHCFSIHYFIFSSACLKFWRREPCVKLCLFIHHTFKRKYNTIVYFCGIGQNS